MGLGREMGTEGQGRALNRGVTWLRPVDYKMKVMSTYYTKVKQPHPQASTPAHSTLFYFLYNTLLKVSYSCICSCVTIASPTDLQAPREQGPCLSPSLLQNSVWHVVKSQ